MCRTGSAASAPRREPMRELTVAPEAVGPYLESYGRMLLIRLFEQEMQRLFLGGEVHGTTHLAAGQEAIPVGVCQALRPDDYVAGDVPRPRARAREGHGPGGHGRRDARPRHGHLRRALGLDERDRPALGPRRVLRHRRRLDRGRHRRGRSAKRQGRVAAAFFGDGATNQAYFFECLNFAKVLELPVVFACENNLYGEFTPMQKVTAGADIARRAEPFGIPPAWSTATTSAQSSTRPARRSTAPARARARRCSSARPTATTATPSPIPPTTGRPGSSSAGRSATRSSIARARLVEAGVTEEQIEAVERRRRASSTRRRRGRAAPRRTPSPPSSATEFAPA